MEKKFVLLLFLASMSACAQWDDCDLGLVNDSYPGSCGKYIDTNNDGICDHSQEQPTTTITQKTQVTSTTQAASPPRAQRQYNLLALAAGLIALYLLSYGLTKTKHLSLVGQRKIWNVFLTASFIAVALTAFFIAVRIEFGQNISIIPDNSYWHIEFGVAMIVIAVFHALWHWRYYLALLKRK